MLPDQVLTLRSQILHGNYPIDRTRVHYDAFVVPKFPKESCQDARRLQSGRWDAGQGSHIEPNIGNLTNV